MTTSHAPVAAAAAPAASGVSSSSGRVSPAESVQASSVSKSTAEQDAQPAGSVPSFQATVGRRTGGGGAGRAPPPESLTSTAVVPKRRVVGKPGLRNTTSQDSLGGSNFAARVSNTRRSVRASPKADPAPRSTASGTRSHAGSNSRAGAGGRSPTVPNASFGGRRSSVERGGASTTKAGSMASGSRPSAAGGVASSLGGGTPKAGAATSSSNRFTSPTPPRRRSTSLTRPAATATTPGGSSPKGTQRRSSTHARPAPSPANSRASPSHGRTGPTGSHTRGTAGASTFGSATTGGIGGSRHGGVGSGSPPRKQTTLTVKRPILKVGPLTAVHLLNEIPNITGIHCTSCNCSAKTSPSPTTSSNPLLPPADARTEEPLLTNGISDVVSVNTAADKVEVLPPVTEDENGETVASPKAEAGTLLADPIPCSPAATDLIISDGDFDHEEPLLPVTSEEKPSLPTSASIDETEDKSFSFFSREGFIASHKVPLSECYDLEKSTLGQGTYGSVSRGTHKITNAIRAIKVIQKAKVTNAERLRQEIGIMKFLDHPNIIKLYETFEDDQHFYLALELCTGGELFDRIIDAGFFSEKNAARMMHQILSAIFYLHNSTSVVHRDIKPENFLFLDKSEESPLKIIDFGLATPCKDDTILRTKAGTPYYVAPQVLNGSYSNKCDVWSAGVIMYILLCGYPPFHGDKDAEILKRVKAGKVTFNTEDWKDVTEEAKDLIRGLLLYDEEERVTAAAALKHPWFAISDLARPSAAIGKQLTATLLTNFKAFKQQSKLKKAAITSIARQLEDDKITKFKELFLALDSDNDGSISVEEMKDALTQSGLDQRFDVERLIREVDSDGSGRLDYTEFIAAALDRSHYVDEATCWQAFKVFDLDGDGQISRQELLQVLHANRAGLKAEKEVEDLIREVDRDGDGMVDFAEFWEMMKSDKIPTASAIP